MNTLEITNLNKTYKCSDFKLKNISFSVPQGSIMGFVGENGAGKSTTIGCILNTLLRESGSVKVFGEEMTDASFHLRDEIGVVYDTSPFPEKLTPKQIARAMKFIFTKWDDRLFNEQLKKFKLDKNAKIKTFSRGMTMKRQIACALAHHPKLLVLDEATSGLDPIVRDDILDVFLEFVQDEAHSILLSSHITSDLEKVADYITFIHNGEIIFTESKDELTYNYALMRCKHQQFSQIEKEDILAYRKHDYQVDVLVKNKQACEKKYRDIIIDNVNIEDIMLMLVKGEK